MQDADKLEGSKFHTRYSQFVRFFKQKSQALDKQDARKYNSLNIADEQACASAVKRCEFDARFCC